MYYQSQRYMRSWKLEAFYIAVGLIVLGYLVKGGVTSKAKERVVTVQGIAETEVIAQKIVWPILYKEVGNDLNYLQYTVTTKSKLITDFLNANGVTTDELGVMPVEISDTQTDKQIVSRPYQRYVATSVILVTSTDVEKVYKLISGHTFWKQNIAVVNDDDPQHGITYEYADINSVKAKLMEKAVKNAHAVAEQLANSSDSEVGELKSVSQVQFSFVSKDADALYKKTLQVEMTTSYYLK
ncbi:hypothetical protein EZS27_007369 [termite gut metagenome]|uniref:SIMPL domain-containing protein n=1 Tax=termite gut metagenome TaxID=433724 RepID=A0A5J4SG63_9ZZZZ